jgi:ABC-type uncharacterized transport system substrate-binding protein
MMYNAIPKRLVSAVWVMIIVMASTMAHAERKRILYIDSYHPSYLWSEEITRGITSVLDPREDIQLKIFRMDTKRNKSEAHKRQAARKAAGLIDTWNPHVVIASDDNASKYLIAPYYRGKSLPVVFCGLNWDASVYGFPADNVTGMVEEALYLPTVETLKPFASGDRIGFLSSDTETERKNLEQIRKRFDTVFDVRFAQTFAQLKQSFLDLQRECDMVLIRECRSVTGFDHDEMVAFVQTNTVVPTGATERHIVDYALVTLAKSGEEQGEYAARTALEILAGKSPKDIPIVANKKAKRYLNMRLAKKLGITFPMEMIENAELISAEQKKLLFVNSYHKGYRWSDHIEMGLLKALNITLRPDGEVNTDASGVLLKIVRMDTKNNPEDAFKKAAALEVKAVIDAWHPDILVASDDNAAKYLVAPYYRNTALPVVFCGVNWDASIYGFPADNITGMVEVSPYLETIQLMQRFARGNRIGLIGADTYSNRRELQYLQETLKLDDLQVRLAEDFEAWKQAYLWFQDHTDMLLSINNIGIVNWDPVAARDFILDHTRIVSGGISDNNIENTLLGRVNIAEEQGWWAGKTALRILGGTPPSVIPITTNKQSKLFLNMQLAKRMGVHFPMDMIAESTFVGDWDGTWGFDQ